MVKSNNKMKLKTYSLINDDDGIDASFQDDNISFDTINDSAIK